MSVFVLCAYECFMHVDVITFYANVKYVMTMKCSCLCMHDLVCDHRNIFLNCFMEEKFQE